MKCPVDQSDMLVVEYQQIELDYCPRCRGVWFDSGELDLLLPAVKPEKLEAKPAGAKRKCPVCGKTMRESIVGRDPGVPIDICPQGEGLWFDGGEIEQLVTQQTSGTAGAPERILSFLSEVFKANK